MYHTNVYIPGDGDTEGISNPACGVFPRPPHAWMYAHSCPPDNASSPPLWRGDLLDPYFSRFLDFISDFCPLTSAHATVL